RPNILDPIFAPVSTLPRIGPKLTQLFAKLIARSDKQEARIIDLILLPPFRVMDRGAQTKVEWVKEGTDATVTVTIDRYQWAPEGKSRLPQRIHCSDDTQDITLTFFQAKRQWLEKAFPIGETVTVFGHIEFFNGRISMVHPEKITMNNEDGTLRMIEPVYPRVSGLTQRVLLHTVEAALSHLPELPEWGEPSVLAGHNLPAFNNALKSLHNPVDQASLEPLNPYRKRLAYDEFLAAQLALGIVRRGEHKLPGNAKNSTGKITSKLLSALPYELTGAQQRSIAEISHDLSSNNRMLRLLQGDVGSGKTIVALFAMAQAAEAGFQSVLMAPTEILARQHFAGLQKPGEAAGLRLGLLTGKMRPSEKNSTLKSLAEGELDCVFGTHALFQEKVAFKNLGLVVVDEQHRFGVHQRIALSAKGSAPDMLVMTATPIPRTLVLAAYGDMDSSKLDEKPKGRLPIHTIAMPAERLEDLAQRVEMAIQEGAKIYWICPLVEDSEELEHLTSAEKRHEWAAKRFSSAAGLIHGRMDSAEKDAAMTAFRTGQIPLLIATTVIEVGVDVPDATIIILENAERFGLAQLHQLRGRVGRGDKPSSCVLLYSGPLSANARARLDIMRQTEDGFRIAEEDLKLRVEGELLGSRQSGEVSFRLADLSAHKDMLEIARNDAKLFLMRDPELTSERGKALSVLLYLFGREQAAHLL
ncbi:MAG: ATP-dependent DNA helicase RecG, partial [Notoacmeibacter sp.]